MQESSTSGPPTFFLPHWARIAFACFMFAVSAVAVLNDFFRFDWVGFLCFGLFYLVYVPRQKGEAPKAYASKPRTIVSVALIIAVVALALHTLHYLFTKYRF
jgi:hypothetical protein